MGQLCTAIRHVQHLFNKQLRIRSPVMLCACGGRAECTAQWRMEDGCCDLLAEPSPPHSTSRDAWSACLGVWPLNSVSVSHVRLADRKVTTSYTSGMRIPLGRANVQGMKCHQMERSRKQKQASSSMLCGRIAPVLL